jgi:hypothetical protein
LLLGKRAIFALCYETEWADVILRRMVIHYCYLEHSSLAYAGD